MRTTRWDLLSVAFLLVAVLSASAQAQNSATPPSDKYVTREEYDKLKAKLDTVLQEVDQLKKDKVKEKDAGPSPAETQAELEEITDQIGKIEAKTQSNSSGFDRFLVTGDIGASFTTAKGSTSTFDAGFSPIFLWRISDNLLVQAGFDFGLGNGALPDGTGGTYPFDLSLADISYIVNDYLTVDAGLFAVPFGQYHTHFDPRWINPLPDDPLAFGDDALGPQSQVGLMLQGAAPLGYDAKINYAVYATNGPTLITAGTPTGPQGSSAGAPGTGALDFTNYADANNDKAVGGRIGLIPIPGMEFGYSAQFAQVNPANSAFSFQDATALLQAVDFNYSHQIDPLGGFITFHTEWIYSATSGAQYGVHTPDGQNFGPITFSSYRNGGYSQLSYRPINFNNKIIKNLEGIFRYDYVQVPGPPGSGWVQRYTPGIDYWVNSSTVFKLAYDFYDSHSHSTPNTDGLTAEFDVGF